MLVDTHAHLTDKAFFDDSKEVILNAQQSGVAKIITSGYNLKSSIEALEFAKEHDGVYASIGVYPENAEEYNQETEDKLAEMSKDEKVVAIGEIGLQYTEGMPDKEIQKEVFVRQLQLANKLRLPIVIHCREAFGDMMQLLKENHDLLENSGTFHCFSGSLEIANEAIKLGLYISVGGVSTFKNATRLQEAIKEIPIDKIILETDCPYLSPHPYRSKRNEPQRIATIAENLAMLKGLDKSEVERITSENVRRLFNI